MFSSQLCKLIDSEIDTWCDNIPYPVGVSGSVTRASRVFVLVFSMGREGLSRLRGLVYFAFFYIIKLFYYCCTYCKHNPTPISSDLALKLGLL